MLVDAFEKGTFTLFANAMDQKKRKEKKISSELFDIYCLFNQPSCKSIYIVNQITEYLHLPKKVRNKIENFALKCSSVRKYFNRVMKIDLFLFFCCLFSIARNIIFASKINISIKSICDENQLMHKMCNKIKLRSNQ